jgi:TPR repeat protein
MKSETVATTAAVAAVIVALLTWLVPFHAVGLSPIAFSENGLSGKAVRPDQTSTHVSSGQQPIAVETADVRPQTLPADAGKPQEWQTTTVAERAAAGDRAAQVELADMYYHGRGLAKDHSKALSWYEAAAALGDLSAQVQAGWMFSRGIGATVDREKAAAWFRRAAVAGNARAQNYLGYAYRMGWGVPIDYQESRKWLAASARQDDYLGQYNYGVLLERGLGGPVDLDTAIDLYRRSAARGYADARDALRRLHVN